MAELNFRALQEAVLYGFLFGELTTQQIRQVAAELNIRPIRLSFIAGYETYHLIDGTNE